jgi:hypothetical protein
MKKRRLLFMTGPLLLTVVSLSPFHCHGHYADLSRSVASGGSNPLALDKDVQDTIRRRDGKRCCVTGKAGSLRDPLIVTPILPVPSGWTTDKVRSIDVETKSHAMAKTMWLTVVASREYLGCLGPSLGQYTGTGGSPMSRILAT